jgi:MSHA biogenesis protein MshK
MNKAYGDLAVLLACGLALLVSLSAANAQALADPTRPPAALEQTTTTPAGADPAAAAAAPTLQSIVRRTGGKPAALINGEYVMEGEMVGEAKVVKIGEDFVALTSSAGSDTLYLTPGIDKMMKVPRDRPPRAAAAKPPKVARKSKPTTEGTP